MKKVKNTSQRFIGSPKVTIITIVLNGEAFIRQTMESVLEQNYEHIEYIVIDGGSTDQTLSIIKEYESRLAHWVSETDRGISHAFNKGIRVAKGDIIGCINAGDWYEDDAVKLVVDAFLANQDVGVVCGALQFWRGNEKDFLCSSVPSLLEREMTVTHPTCFVLKDLYARFGLFSEVYRLAMDYELLLRMKAGEAVFLALDHVLANMQHDGVSEENWQAALKETHRARGEILAPSFYTSNWYYTFLCIKRSIRVLCEKMGFESLLRFYRKRIALVKKTR